MNASSPSQTRLVIVGATGMVGGYALRYALGHPAVGRVVAIGRKTIGISHSKLKCKRRSNYPSLKRPDNPVAPE